MQSTKLSPSASYWFKRFWQTFIWCYFCSSVSIMGSTWCKLCNIQTLPSSFPMHWSSVHSSLIVICWSVWMSWLRCPPFHGATAVYGHHEHGLSFMLLLLLLKCTPYCLTVLMSAVWSPQMFVKCLWMSAGAIFLLHEGIQFCIFASYTLLCQTPVCQTASPCWHLSQGNKI